MTTQRTCKPVLIPRPALGYLSERMFSVDSGGLRFQIQQLVKKEAPYAQHRDTQLSKLMPRAGVGMGRPLSISIASGGGGGGGGLLSCSRQKTVASSFTMIKCPSHRPNFYHSCCSTAVMHTETENATMIHHVHDSNCYAAMGWERTAAHPWGNRVFRGLWLKGLEPKPETLNHLLV